MKRYYLVILTFSLFLSMSAYAVDVTKNGINYTLDVSSRTAKVAGSSLENVVVPETIYYDGVTYTVTAIGYNAFRDNKTIVSIKTGNTIKTLEEGAFSGASNLQKVDFNNALEHIDDWCFNKCINLKYLVLPKTISFVYRENVFYDCPTIIICLKEGFNTKAVSRTIYPSSFFTFNNSITDYNGKAPEANYTFNGIGFGFQPTAVNLDALVATAGNHTSELTFTIANNDMSFDVDIPYTYTINPVTLTAKVSDASRLYGDADPQFSSTYTGFVNNEDASVVTSHGSYTTTATAKSDVGTYAIKQTGATAQNYVFEYENGTLTVNKAPLTMTANDKITFTVPVTNTGKRAGAETVQLYVSDLQSSVERPVKELKAFRKVFLQPGETQQVTLTIDKNSLSFYDDRDGQWTIEPGDFEARIGTSSMNIINCYKFTFIQ